MTTLEEIKQRDAEYRHKTADDIRRSLRALLAESVLDRRWLLARVEALSTALREALGTHGEVCEPNAYCSVRSHAQDALASLTEPVSSQEEKS